MGYGKGPVGQKPQMSWGGQPQQTQRQVGMPQTGQRGSWWGTQPRQTQRQVGMPQWGRPRGGWYDQLKGGGANLRQYSWQPLLGRGLTRVAQLPKFAGEQVQPAPQPEPQPEPQPIQQAAFQPQTWYMGKSKTGQPVYMQSVQGGGYQRVYSPQGNIVQPSSRGRGPGQYTWGHLPAELQQMRQQWAQGLPWGGYGAGSNEWLNI